MAEAQYDFIITGAGSAGCVLAARLSESGRFKVLLLEAGGPDTNWWIHVPMGYAKTFAHPVLNWRFESEPEKELNGRTMYQPRGKVLGGTSSINGMIYMRGNAADYDQWRQLGNEGWDYESVLPFFRKAEDNERGADEFHGVGGPLRVSNQPYEWEIAHILVEACQQAGIPFNPDFNGAKQEGCGYYQTTTKDKRRWSTAAAYLNAAKKRPNLTVRTHAHATRILFKDGRAHGVEFSVKGRPETAYAGREVIVSGGAYGSPQLLQLSGVGPAQHLQEMGVEVFRDMAGVGSNLQDHFNTYCTYRISRNLSLNGLSYSFVERMKAGAQYVFLRSGPMSGNGLYAGALVRTDKRLERPDMQINISNWSVVERNAKGIVSYPFPGISLSPVHLAPDGRGTVRLRSGDPMAPPEIRFNFLRTENDMRAMIAGVRIVRSIVRQHAMQKLLVEETSPGVAIRTDEEIAADIRERGVSNLHPVGTCGMGHGPTAVVDPRLRVHGIPGLRVVDASVMPTIPAGNTNAPTIMIAEKASDMIQEDARAVA
ncbi:MAG TPA: choline dehydrogenase [Rhodopila sp.]|nr:choline dehydrogenase [Rhodopila sp.]